MGALDAQEVSVLRVLWGTMLLLMAFWLCILVFTFQMVHVNFGGMGTKLREVHLCNKGNTNLQNTILKKNSRLVLFASNVVRAGWAESYLNLSLCLCLDLL